MYACEVCLMSTVVYSVDKVLFIVAIVGLLGSCYHPHVFPLQHRASKPKDW